MAEQKTSSQSQVRYTVKLTAPLGAEPSYFWVADKFEVMAFLHGGRVRVFSSLCPHMGAAFTFCARKKRLLCPWHGLTCDIRTGKTNHPRYPGVREYPAHVAGNELLIYDP